MLPQSLQAPLEAWLLSLSVKGYAHYTLLTYRQAVNEFGAFLLGRGLTQWTQCQRAEVTGYFACRIEQGLGATSAKLYLSALSQFFEHLAVNDPTKGFVNPAKAHRIRGKSERLPKLLDVNTVAKLLDVPAPNEPKAYKLWLRDRAMFELLYSSGLRVGELVGLDVAHVDVLGRLVCVLGKGNKQRIVPIGKIACTAIQAYLPLQSQWSQCQALFVSERGKRLTPRAVQYRLEKWAKWAGIELQLHPHLLRHAFASHMLSSSGDLRAVQDMLGHASVATTQIYTHLDFATLSNLYQNAHPRAYQPLNTTDE